MKMTAGDELENWINLCFKARHLQIFSVARAASAKIIRLGNPQNWHIIIDFFERVGDGENLRQAYRAKSYQLN